MSADRERRGQSSGGRSRDRRRDDDDNALAKIFTVYRFALRTNPILVKSLTSGVVAALGNISAQMISPQGAGGRIAWSHVMSFGAFNAVVTGPMTHYLYQLMENIAPRNTKYSALSRVAIDRLLFAPPYLLVFFFVTSILEGMSVSQAVERVRLVFWTALKMNWKVWTLAQYVNFCYVPLQYRVLFANLISFVWNVYLAFRR